MDEEIVPTGKGQRETFEEVVMAIRQSPTKGCCDSLLCLLVVIAVLQLDGRASRVMVLAVDAWAPWRPAGERSISSAAARRWLAIARSHGSARSRRVARSRT